VGSVNYPVVGDTVEDGRRSRWAAHRATRRDELIDAAVRTIVRHGADVGMDQIAADAATSKPVIYRYFADKTDLYRAVTDRVVGTILTTLRAVTEADVAADGEAAREVIRRSVDAYLALLEQAPELYRFVVHHPSLPPAAGETAGRTFSDVIAEMLADQLAGPLRAGGLDPSYAHPWGEAIVGFISAASLWWLDHPGAMSRTQLSDYLAALLWGGAAGVHQYAGQDVDARPADGVFPLLPH
jgi:AcrR family transcriptional regulator